MSQLAVFRVAKKGQEAAHPKVHFDGKEAQWSEVLTCDGAKLERASFGDGSQGIVNKVVSFVSAIFGSEQKELPKLKIGETEHCLLGPCIFVDGEQASAIKVLKKFRDADLPGKEKMELGMLLAQARFVDAMIRHDYLFGNVLVHKSCKIVHGKLTTYNVAVFIFLDLCWESYGSECQLPSICARRCACHQAVPWPSIAMSLTALSLALAFSWHVTGSLGVSLGFLKVLAAWLQHESPNVYLKLICVRGFDPVTALVASAVRLD